ncbi:hypothetical protein GXM_08501 [Nostoc sphaeroides CCNUC1]|uniref:Uncharacterized protein n=1 Tax=Nostoc sphaeroides CCNUC1 TaxID=2653204 RepID=A0A5P8WDU7_9NOSO|nr:hypothetical protein GXM_08501 [Nostoc sphaeroides CCNUC1]
MSYPLTSFASKPLAISKSNVFATASASDLPRHLFKVADAAYD